MATTNGIRTWKRVSGRTDLPLNERVIETTNLADMETAIRQADFITIPKAVYNTSGQRIRDGYDDAYATRLARVLMERFDYAGQVRPSLSGNSHVFEREAATSGAAFDFGLSATASALPPIVNGHAAA